MLLCKGTCAPVGHLSKVKGGHCPRDAPRSGVPADNVCDWPLLNKICGCASS